MRILMFCLALATPVYSQQGQRAERARDLGIPFEGEPGANNAITDVDGVYVGHTTLIQGDDVRTGVTAIFPRGDDPKDPVFAGWFALNGNGEMTGTTWITESGFLEGPVCITNTHSVGVVRDAVIGWQVARGAKLQPWSLPVVAETYDGHLNDTDGFHVTAAHARRALDSAKSGPVPEGNVGGGTGMRTLGFKGGIGTSSRRVRVGDVVYTLGALVQSNFGRADQLRVDGVPVGRELLRARAEDQRDRREEQGSIIVIVATDAPLLPHQLDRVARRVSLGIARVGSTSGNGSGDIFLAFSTANRGAAIATQADLVMLANHKLSALFDATVQATEEAILNAMVAAETMVGRAGHRSEALPHDQLCELLERFGRLKK